MIEEKRINYPSTAFGIEKYHKELQEMILDGYRVQSVFGKSKCFWGARHAITLVKETPDTPLDKLKDPKLKKPEVIKIAQEDFGLEVPESLSTPNAIKKYIRESVAKKEEPKNTEE